jgi:isoquinoline 1-oxidoreductase beta subunit
MNATARWTPERCEVWTPTQNGEAALAATSEAAGLPAAQCEVYKMHLGGGFGRRGAVHDWVRRRADRQGDAGHAGQADLVARGGHAARPLPPGHAVQAARGLDAQGNITALHMRISGQSILAGMAPQNIQNGKDPVVFQGLNAPGRRPRSATASRTCWSTTRCATRRCRRASGAA